MKIAIDTKEDSHEDIRRVIKMLQNLVGDPQEVFTNQAADAEPNNQESGAPFNSIFGDSSPSQESPQDTAPPEASKPAEPEEASQSTDDLFAELFSEEELKKMDTAKIKEEDEEPKTKSKKYGIELY